MDILTSQLPSGGFGYKFSTVSLRPMNFLEICSYLDNVPKDPLEKYLFEIKSLTKEDPNILDCYIMDLDFLIFYKKLCTISSDLTYNVSIKCPICGKELKKTISLEKDIHFKQADEKIMSGAVIELGGNRYETIVPTVRDFMKVFDIYLRFKKITDLKMIKTISLIKDFNVRGNQIEQDILGATHSDITLLMALRELYFDRVEPIVLTCPVCSKDENIEGKERGKLTVSVESLIVDFFRDLYNNSPIDGSKILFK